MHDFRMVPGKDHTNLILDAVLPVDLWPRTEEIRDHIESSMSSQGKGQFYAVITFDSVLFNEKAEV